MRRFKDGVLESFTTADGLAGNDVKTIIEARAGGLWIGTYGGLTRIENRKFTSWRETEGLPSRTVRSLYEDADGTLWIGSYDGSLGRFKDGKFTRYNTKTGLPNDGAFQILEDDSRHFWVSSNRGIYRVSRDELNDFDDGKISRVNSIAYGKSDGMLNAECNGGRSPAGIRAGDGRLWFPTQDGVAVVDPQEIKSNSQPPPVVIESVKIDNILSEPPAPTGGHSVSDTETRRHGDAEPFSETSPRPRVSPSPRLNHPPANADVLTLQSIQISKISRSATPRFRLSIRKICVLNTNSKDSTTIGSTREPDGWLIFRTSRRAHTRFA